jgi:hypothetical protein
MPRVLSLSPFNQKGATTFDTASARPMAVRLCGVMVFVLDMFSFGVLLTNDYHPNYHHMPS